MSETNKLYEKFNFDDILVRSVIGGVLDLLNNKIDYTQTWDDTIEETVEVPWMYSMGTSDERFVQDNYTFFGETCFGDRKINGTFNSIPRGYLTYNGSKIEASSITNRFIQGKYLKSKDGKLTTYTSFLYVMPLTIDFECKVICDNVITALKIEQAIRETFYKNKSFFVDFRGMRIGCSAGFPEQYNSDAFRVTDYSFDNVQKRPELSFSLSVETYHPVFDKTTEMEVGKYIKSFGGDVYTKITGDKMDSIKFTNIDTSVIYPSGSPFLIEWADKSNHAEFLTIDLLYKDSCGCENIIENGVNNQGFYIWNIPENFGEFKQPKIYIEIDDEDRIIKHPDIKIVPENINGNYVISEKSFVLVEPGYIITQKEIDKVPISIEYKNTSGKKVVIPSGKYWLNVIDGKVDEEIPVIFDDNSGAKNYEKFKGDVKITSISLIIRKSGKNEIYDEISNLLII